MMASKTAAFRLGALVQRRFTAAAAAAKPYGKPTTYRHSIWQGTPPPATLKPEEFWPAQAMTFSPKTGLIAQKAGRKILVGVGTSDWAGSVTALRTALLISTDKDEVLVFNAPKLIPDFQKETLILEGKKMAALVKAVQDIAKELKRPVPRIEMAPLSHQPKVEILKKVVGEEVDVVVLGNGRYPANALGNVASYVSMNAPCDVLLVKGGSVAA